MTLNVAGCSLPYWNTVGWAQRRRTAGTKGSCFQCSKDGDRFFENYAETCERNAENVKKRYTTATDVYDGNDRIRKLSSESESESESESDGEKVRALREPQPVEKP